MKHIRRFLFLLAMLSAVTFGMSQTIIVKDSITNEPISFVSVCFGKESGCYTDERGMITIPDGAAQIRLSHICYETKVISKMTEYAQTIFLVPKNINLDEVAVSAKVPKRIKTTEVGLKKAKTHAKHKGVNGFEMALFIPYDSTWTETPYIHSILASLDYSTHYLVFTEIKNPIYATLRFDLRLPDAKTGWHYTPFQSETRQRWHKPSPSYTISPDWRICCSGVDNHSTSLRIMQSCALS